MSDHEEFIEEEQERNIELSEEVGEGDYANLVMIAHSQEEFIMDFIRILPGLQRPRVRHRVIMTPPHTKRLLRALSDNMHRYERAYGKIKDSSTRDAAIQLGGSNIGQA